MNANAGSTAMACPNGAAFNLLNYLFKPGISGGQIAHGGVAAGEVLTLQGANNTPDVGRINIASPIDFTYDTVSNTTPAEPYLMEWQESFTVGAYVGGFLRFAPEITTSSSTYIPGVFVDFGVTTVGAAPGFWAYTFINCLHRIESGAGFNLGNALVINVGVNHVRETAGTSTAPGSSGMNFAPQTRAEVSGAVMRKTTGDTGLTVNPSYSAVAGSTADMGETIGVRVGGNATVALGGSGAGTLIRDAVVGLDFLNLTDTVGGDIAAVRSTLTAGTSRFFLQNLSTADSEFGSSEAHFNDNNGPTFGNTLAAPDVRMNWNGSALEFDPAVGDDMRISFATDIHTIVSASVSEDSAINFDYPKGAFGEAGAPGNNKYRFVANAETVTIGGGFAQFLLTQSANDTLDAGMSQYFGWTINAPTPSIGTGSLTDGGALLIGGNINVGTNRYGVLILSNPSGGTLNYALRVQNGDSRFDGRTDINNGVALGGGAAATLGTIGGSGPTAAAQAQWLEIDIGGVAHWIPVWT